MVKSVDYNEYLPQALKQLPAGAFLTTKRGDEVNTMTIGWGTVGFIWGLPIFTVAVRYSRHTYEMIDKAGEFTVSFPLDNSMKKELGICGTKSGRDMDKFKECNLTAQPGQAISTPVVGECPLHYECIVVYKQAMEPALISEEIDQRYYGNNDFHILYYGKIVATYLNE